MAKGLAARSSVSRPAVERALGRGATALAPLVILGAPRSGTSLLYKALCLHPGAAWLSNWLRRFPGVPALAVLNRLPRHLPELQRDVWFGADGANAYVYNRSRTLAERLFPMPVEGEPLYRRHGLSDERAATPAELSEEHAQSLRASVQAVVRYSGGTHLVSKRIANNRRVPQLVRAFPEARFVEIIRDGRAVAYSLSRVNWWEDEHVWWFGGTPRQWRVQGGDPWELCGRHWVRELGAIERGLEPVASAQRLRIRYEQLVADPIAALRAVATFAGLGPDQEWTRRLQTLSYPNKNETWRDRLAPEAIATLERVQSEGLRRHGYLTAP